MARKIICSKCKTELSIEKNEITSSVKKELEFAFCPICENEILKEYINGWFFVKKIDEKTENNAIQQCIYPMA